MRTGVPGFNGERLRQAREALGLSQTSLADIIGVTKQAISQYEGGADSPSQAVFDQLRGLLRHDAHFFLRPSFSHESSARFYRSMASATRTSRTRAEARQFWIRELLEFISESVELPRVNFPVYSKEPRLLSMEEIEMMALDVRSDWKLGDAPIANLVDVAESYGAVVVRHSLDSAALDALSEWLQPEDRPFIILNSDKNVSVRSRLDLGHELGHMILHRHLTQEFLKDKDQFELIEEQAFRFGAALLLPERPFLDDLYSVSLDALRSAKLKWKVSVAMMIERLKDLGIINQDQHRRMRINYNTRKWNREEPYEQEIPIEAPTLFAKSIQLLVSQQIQSVDQIAAHTGLSVEWIEQLLELPTQPKLNVSLKVVEFKRRA